MKSFPELLIGKKVSDWSRWEHWGIRLFSGLLAFALFVFPFLLRSPLRPVGGLFLPAIVLAGLAFALIVMIFVSHRLPGYVRKPKEENGDGEEG